MANGNGVRRKPKEIALGQANKLHDAITLRTDKLAGFGCDDKIQEVLTACDGIVNHLQRLSDDFKPKRGSRVVVYGKVYQVKRGVERYTKLAGEDAEYGIAVEELDEKTIRLQVGDNSFIPVLKADLGKQME